MGEQQQEQPFPRYYFSKDEPQGRVFQNQQELDEAGGSSQWFKTPTEAADAAAQAATPAPSAPEPPPSDDEPPPVRSRR